MSYTVEVEATQRECDHQSQGELLVTTLAGGERYGPMVQLAVRGGYVQLTMVQLRYLRAILDYAQEHSLADWPGAS